MSCLFLLKGVLKLLLSKEKLELNEEATVSNALYCCALLGRSDDDLNQKTVFCRLDGVSVVLLVIRRLLCYPFDKRHMDNMYEIVQ